jgi:hypothetical protein
MEVQHMSDRRPAHQLEVLIQHKEKGLAIPAPGMSSPSKLCSVERYQPYLPILNTFVPQVGHTPWVAGLLFFMTMLLLRSYSEKILLQLRR